MDTIIKKRCVSIAPNAVAPGTFRERCEVLIANSASTSSLPLIFARSHCPHRAEVEPMPKGERTKELSFRLWKEGKSLAREGNRRLAAQALKGISQPSRCALDGEPRPAP